MNQIIEWIIDTFDLKSNDTFRKVVGTGLTVLALVFGGFSAAAQVIGVDVPGIACSCDACPGD